MNGGIIMKMFSCPVCGYVYEGENAPEKCPQCGLPGTRLTESANFIMEIEDVLSVVGRGIIATGIIHSGTISHNETVYINGISYVVMGIESDRKIIESASMGMPVGLLLRGARIGDFKKGDIVSKHNISLDKISSIKNDIISKKAYEKNICKSCGGELEKEGNIYTCKTCGAIYNQSELTSSKNEYINQNVSENPVNNTVKPVNNTSNGSEVANIIEGVFCIIGAIILIITIFNVLN